MDDPTYRWPTYRWIAWRGALAAVIGLVVMAVAYHFALLAAYQLAQGSLAGASGAPGSSYLADDLHAVWRRSVATILVALPVFSLVHYYGRRGPVTAAIYGLVVGVTGFLSFARDFGPLDRIGQYLAYAVPALVAMMVVWRISYRRV